MNTVTHTTLGQYIEQNPTTLNLRFQGNSRDFLAELPESSQVDIIHELRLINDGLSLEFEVVKHETVINAVCDKYSLNGPYRYKTIAILHGVGGVRAIFAFDESKSPRLMYVFRIASRDKVYTVDKRNGR